MKLNKIKNSVIAILLSVGCVLPCIFMGCNDGSTTVETTKFADTEIVFCENQQTEYKVVIPANPSVAIEWVANELVTYVQKSTGAVLEIQTDDKVGNATTQQKIISIGKTALFNTTGVTVTQEELTTEGYKIIRKDNTVYICGNRDWGTSFGVFEFMHHQIGFEPYTSSEVYYDTLNLVKIKDYGTYIDVPDFEGRAMDGIANVDPTTAYYLRTVPYYGSGEARFSYNKKSAWIPGPDHTITMILPEKEYPDYYKTTTQLCYSNENLYQDFKKELIDLIIANPDGYIVNVGQEDGKGYCECPTCAADRALYATSGYWVRFMNRLIGDIEQWKQENCPDRYLIYATFAYGGTSAPPVKQDDNGNYSVIHESCVPHQKLYMKITLGACGTHSMFDETCEKNTKVRVTYDGWHAITDRFMTWDYAANYINYLPFFNDIDHIQSSYEFYKQQGVINIFSEMNSGGSTTGFGWLRLYLRAKCMWDVNQDIETLIDNFFANYYKDTAIYMREVFDMFRSHQKTLALEGGYHISSITYLDTKIWPRNIVDQAKELIEKALELCDTMEDQDTASKLRPRIEEELVCVELLQLYFYKEYGYDMNDYDAFIDKFEQKTIEMNISRFREHETMAKFLASLRV